MTSGYIYALRSDACPFLKIGRTNTLPYRRLKELNASPNYGSLGPWEIVSYIEVLDEIVVETFLHRSIRDKHCRHYPGCNELFDLSPAAALELFNQVPAAEIRGFDRVARLHSTETLEAYLADIFRLSGLEHMLAQQGIWCLTMFPSTAGGRYFTINIDRHEVGFSSLPGRGLPARHMLLLDPLIEEYPDAISWLENHNGGVLDGEYASGLEGQFPILFEGKLEDAREFIALAGVRRALVAYWYDLLLQTAEAGRGSFFAKHHNLAAVQSIMRLRQKQIISKSSS